VQVALEVIPNDISAASSLVHFIEEELDLDDLGICLDFGHAHLQGDVLDAVETCSGHLVTTHVHDNMGRIDDHLMPFDGTIDWLATLQGVQKIGYDGAFIFELANHSTPKETLRRAQQVRRRFEDILGEE
jgi:sugar phosphate isomerase/epimerase